MYLTVANVDEMQLYQKVVDNFSFALISVKITNCSRHRQAVINNNIIWESKTAAKKAMDGMWSSRKSDYDVTDELTSELWEIRGYRRLTENAKTEI